MGGKLFNFGRMPRVDYLRLEGRLRVYLDGKFGSHYRIPRYYRMKPDFGDMDVILGLPSEDPGAVRDVYREIVADLGVERSIDVGHCFSTAYENLQVDYFQAEPRLLDCTYNYLSFNDLGNLLGRIFRRSFNLKYGMEGLAYIYRWKDGHRHEMIEITTHTRRMLEFLEVDSAAWETGFDELEDVFEWVIACPHFSADPYVDPAGAFGRRTSARTTVERFVEYLARKGVARSVPKPENRDEQLPRIAAFFPESDLLAKVEAARDKEALVGELRARFNGRIVMDCVPGLSGARLGRFIEAFKRSIPDFDTYVIGAGETDVRERIIAFSATWAPDETL